MAHKKKHKKRSHVGAVNLKRGPIIKLAAVAAGYFLGDTINAQVDKILPASWTAPTTTTSTTGFSIGSVVPVAGELGIGTLLMMHKKTGMVGDIAGGLLVGAGVRRLMKQTGMISGYQSTPVIGARNRRMAGYQSTPVIGGMPSQLSGVPNQLSGTDGYRVGAYVPSGSGSGYMQ